MRDLVKDRATFVALDRLAVIRAQYITLRDEGLPAEEAVDGAVTYVGSMDFDHSRGKFVYGVFFDKTNDFFVFRDESLPDNVTAEQIVGSDRSQMPDFGQEFSSVVRIDGRSAVHVVVPIPASTGHPTSWFNGIYLLSPASSAALTREALGTKLTDGEFEIMKTHVDHGLDIVGNSRWLEDALAIVGFHHEKCGGDGYPAQVPGDMIPMAARIFAITDVFDALSSERPYKEAMPLEKVLQILEEGRNLHFDPNLLSSFMAIAPDLHAEMTGTDIAALRSELHRINERYFASGMEVLPA